MRPLRPLPQPDPAERAAVDWWVRAVPAVVALHVLALLGLSARPGQLAVWTWYVGPILLAVIAAILLVGSLMSARRWRHGVNRWHVMGYVGLILVIFTLPVYEAYPSSYDERPSRVMFRLPLDGLVTVAWGGADAAVNYHVFRSAVGVRPAGGARGRELSWGRHRAGRLLRLQAPCDGASLGRRLCGARWRTGCRDRCAAVGLGGVGQSRWHRGGP